MTKEKWKTIEDFEDYLISSKGRVKSFKYGKEKILKGSISPQGYLQFQINKRTYTAQQLVAIVFLNHIPCRLKYVIDHIDMNTLNNDISNLRIVTNRFNSFRNRNNCTSEYKGVFYNKQKEKYIAKIEIKGKRYNLGTFYNEIKASEQYQKAVSLIEKGDYENLFKLIKEKNPKTSKKENSKGYSFYKSRNKWRARIRIKGKEKHLGYFDCEKLARLAYLKELNLINSTCYGSRWNTAPE
jgi:hypothetical protein